MIVMMSEATPHRPAEPEFLPEEIFQQHRALLTEMARKYIWWMSSEEALEFPARIVAQVMNMGVFRDACQLADALGDDCLRGVLQSAEAGWFNARTFPPSESLKAMVYFEGGDMRRLSSEDRAVLKAAAAGVKTLPIVRVESDLSLP